MCCFVLYVLFNLLFRAMCVLCCILLFRVMCCNYIAL